MDIIGLGASAIAKGLVASIPRQLGYILSYDDNLKKLETEVQKLVGTATNVQHSADEAERNGEKIEDIVQNWRKKANDTVDMAKQLIEIEERVEGCCMGQCYNLWTRNQLSQRFEKMTLEISHVLANGRFDRISYHVPIEVTTTPFCRGYQALDSRTSMLNEIKRALRDPKIDVIGVHGMGGVGKSTLVTELAWQVKKDGSFGAVAIATITHSPDVKNIQDQIADALDRKLEKKTEGGRAGELRQKLEQEKSLLIILDDIWSELDLTKVGIPFGDKHNGCKLVVTSRDLNVLISMSTQKEFNLRALQKEDSWNLFQRMAGDVVEQSNIKPIAVEVAKCCAGFPLLIVTVAKGLRKKDVTAWKDALFQLGRFDHDLQKKVHPTLELSYNWLENVSLKSLFLLIGSFGVKKHIHIEELFLYCWGLGIYGHIPTLSNARNRHYKLINDLRASSLLLEGKPEWIQMHDVVRDVAKSIASGSSPTYAVQSYTKMKEWPKVDQLQKCHHIIFPMSDIYELPESLECPELKLLVLQNTGLLLKVPDNIFSGMREVRTLHLYRMDCTPSLPPSLDLLINLRSLNLHRCNLGDIRMIAKVTNLEILNLEESNIEELPKEIGHLTHLRLLNLANCLKLRFIPANLISSLTCLEGLYMGGCRIHWEVEGSKSESNNASLSELRNLHQLTTLEISIRDTSILPWDFQFPTKLERYNILIGDMWEWSSQWSSGARETSRTLMLTDSWWKNISLTTVEKLSFAKLKHVKDVLYELNEEGFPQLKHLHIKNSGELLHIINSREFMIPYSAFPNLETLVLCNLNNMEEICHGPLPTQSFAKLKVIKVKGCDRLKSLLLYSLVRNLSQLHEIEISSCEDMKEIIALEKQEDEKELPKIVLPELHSLTLIGLPMLLSFYLPLTIDKGNPSIQSIPLALFNQQVVMPKLKTLKLSGIDTFKIWDDNLPVHSCIQNLTRLKVIGCNRLTSFFSSCVARALAKLQHLEISECSMLKEIFVQEEKVEFPNLEALHISNVDDLQSIWPNKLAPNSFCKLKQIKISGNKSLDYVFPVSVAKELRNLQVLEVMNCAIEHVVEKSDSCAMTHVYLEKLKVVNCPNMKTIVPSSMQFQALDELYVGNCHGVVNIIMPSTTTSLPKLRILSIRNCDKIEEIYGSKNESDAPLGEITFMKLEELRLSDLPRLTSFCQGSYNFKFSSLQMVCLNECPMMETFCPGNLDTPSLRKVQFGWRKQYHWDSDLNATIRNFSRKSIQNSKQDMSLASKSKGE